MMVIYLLSSAPLCALIVGITHEKEAISKGIAQFLEGFFLFGIVTLPISLLLGGMPMDYAPLSLFTTILLVDYMAPLLSIIIGYPVVRLISSGFRRLRFAIPSAWLGGFFLAAAIATLLFEPDILSLRELFIAPTYRLALMVLLPWGTGAVGSDDGVPPIQLWALLLALLLTSAGAGTLDWLNYRWLASMVALIGLAPTIGMVVVAYGRR